MGRTEAVGFAVVVFFQAVGSAPPLKKKKFKVSSEYLFSQIFEQLRKMLRLQAGDALVRRPSAVLVHRTHAGAVLLHQRMVPAGAR